MSGYFSRIARQGGARIAGDRGQRTATPAVKREPQLAPIDVRETVMVTPNASSDSLAARQHKPHDATVQDHTRGDQTRGDHTRAPQAAESSTSAFRSSHVSIDPATEISPAEARRQKSLEPIVEEVKLIESKATRDFSHLPVSPPLKPEARESETLRPIAGDESRKQIPANPRTPETQPAQSTEKKFFEKTVEIVEGQTARPAEVHTILLREVQEWIAAGQTAIEEVTAGVTNSAAEPLIDLSLPSEQPEPGVVRIGESRRTKTAPERIPEVSTTDFSEQHFELSIGSISVVVEGDERTPAPVPAQVAARPAARPAARETTHRTSRLSRHYL
jgi:hypothetical protein